MFRGTPMQQVSEDAAFGQADLKGSKQHAQIHPQHPWGSPRIAEMDASVWPTTPDFDASMGGVGMPMVDPNLYAMHAWDSWYGLRPANGGAAGSPHQLLADAKSRVGHVSKRLGKTLQDVALLEAELMTGAVAALKETAGAVPPRAPASSTSYLQGPGWSAHEGKGGKNAWNAWPGASHSGEVTPLFQASQGGSQGYLWKPSAQAKPKGVAKGAKGAREVDRKGKGKKGYEVPWVPGQSPGAGQPTWPQGALSAQPYATESRRAEADFAAKPGENGVDHAETLLEGVLHAPPVEVSPPSSSVGASAQASTPVPQVAQGALYKQRLSPSVPPAAAKAEAESSSSVDDENTPPELIWCDECAFRESAAAKKAELEALGIRVRGFKSADKCVRSMAKRIEMKKQKGGAQPKTIALVTERNATLIPYLTSRMEEIQLQCIVVLLHQASNKRRCELTFGSVPAIRAIASSWQEAVEVTANIVEDTKVVETTAKAAQ